MPQSANLRRTRSFEPQAVRNQAKGYNPDRGNAAGKMQATPQQEIGQIRYCKPNVVNPPSKRQDIQQYEGKENKYLLPPIGKGAYEYNNMQHKHRDHSSGSRLRNNGAAIMNTPQHQAHQRQIS